MLIFIMNSVRKYYVMYYHFLRSDFWKYDRKYGVLLHKEHLSILIAYC